VRNAAALGAGFADADEPVECSFCGALFLRELLLGDLDQCARCYVKTYGGCGCRYTLNPHL